MTTVASGAIGAPIVEAGADGSSAGAFEDTAASVITKRTTQHLQLSTSNDRRF